MLENDYKIFHRTVSEENPKVDFILRLTWSLTTVKSCDRNFSEFKLELKFRKRVLRAHAIKTRLYENERTVFPTPYTARSNIAQG